MRRALRCLALLLLAVPQARAQEPAPGKPLELPRYTLELPPGWTSQGEGERWGIAPGGAQDFLVAPAGPPVPLQGTSFAGAFLAQWKLARGPRKVLSEAEVAEHQDDAGRTWRVAAASVEEQGTPLAVLFAAVEVDGRLEGFVIVASQEGLERHLSQAERMLLGARFRAAGPAGAAAPAAPAGLDPLAPAPPGRLAGVWARGGARPEVLVLLPDGGLLARLPPEGLDGFEAAAARERWPTAWGSWQLEQGRLRWKVGQAEREHVLGPARELLRPGEVFTPRLSPDGLRLETELRREDHWTLPGAPALHLDAGGNFRDQGLVGLALVPLPGEGPGAAVARGKPGQGKYRLRRFTLTLEYGDGRVTRLAFLPLAGTPPEQVLLGGGLVVVTRPRQG